MTPTEPEELQKLRERLSRREGRARVRSQVRAKRARRRAEQRREALRRGAQLAGETARIRHEISQSGEARAMRVERTRALALAVMLPVLIAFGAWSAAGVQAGMVNLLGLADDSAAAYAAWLVEPALLGIVAGVILIRARLQSAGGDLDERATRIEVGALATSIVLNIAGHWPDALDGAALAALAGHTLGPLGAASSAYLISVVQDGVANADPWTLKDGSPAPSLADTSTSDRAAESASEEGAPAAAEDSDERGGTVADHAAPTPKTNASEEPQRSMPDQAGQASSEVAASGARNAAHKPRSDKGTRLPKALKTGSEKSSRALSDEDLAVLLETAIEDSGLDREPSVAAVQKCLSIGFERAKRVRAMVLGERANPAAAPVLTPRGGA
ncbi:hypothetical protein GCM10009799_03100 [Nocardiopsis rhodophaea]|uniref:DUF2637 domain-containing protein n=1 Tax=Nocardiopsis rhodophaea TaxID=280238 RepID=A0ABN2S6M9_9ACTN